MTGSRPVLSAGDSACWRDVLPDGEDKVAIAVSFDPEAAARVRGLLSGRGDVVEKKMVGGLSFLVNGNMCCGVTGVALMVRVGPDNREQVLLEPHVRQMVFGDRVLSGFICVEPPGYAADDALASWVQRGLDFVAGLPAKHVSPGG
jgi:TfoX/Sxy family transcriptional regulator of competence genes